MGRKLKHIYYIMYYSLWSLYIYCFNNNWEIITIKENLTKTKTLKKIFYKINKADLIQAKLNLIHVNK